MLKPYHKIPELLNVVLGDTEEITEPSELEEDFPYMLTDPNVFDFREIVENNKLKERLGREKRSPAELKIEAIQNFPIPTTKTQIRAFLGLAGYYRQYIPMFSAIVAPLTDLLKGVNKTGKIVWNDKCNESFKMLKEKLSRKPVLHAPDFSKSFILQTDASDQGYGVVLTQKDDNGKEHPILFLSKKFTATERKYSTTEKECAAILYAIKKI
ncbi:retrovirus-related Pol polyprotein from transposon 17.6 [Trichonephila inaurata madagascariensis]|uniref:Retrovirus-related Pol polyprotein from transposon 17.6 n=1 Tax=Trichonephila inaurata madagascariensis TaxID=2747483 RepID=A0A8X7BX79_9ARAC|nr:retrovirus-related Pol polyprotein from transposon 17.6 [Trichonephila inaurata madagascariensis]